MLIQTPTSGAESGENIRSEITIRDGGVLANNPDALADLSFGSFAVAKDTGYTSAKGFTDEDRAVVVTTENAAGEVISLELTVIDGMGGQGKHGDGQIAAEILAARFEDGGDFKAIIDKSQADLDSSLKIAKGAGALFVSFRLKHDPKKDEDLAEIALVGDCRLVIWDENGNKVFATKDQSFVQTLIDDGVITEEQALNHTNRNITGNAIEKGRPAKATQIHRDVVIKPGYTVELCSDGRTDNFTDEEEWENIKGKTAKDGATSSFMAIRGRSVGDNASKIIKPKVDNVTVLIYKHVGRRVKMEDTAVSDTTKAAAVEVAAVVQPEVKIPPVIPAAAPAAGPDLSTPPLPPILDKGEIIDDVATVSVPEPVAVGSSVDVPDMSVPPAPPVLDHGEIDDDDELMNLNGMTAAQIKIFNGKGKKSRDSNFTDEKEGLFKNGVLIEGKSTFMNGVVLEGKWNDLGDDFNGKRFFPGGIEDTSTSRPFAGEGKYVSVDGDVFDGTWAAGEFVKGKKIESNGGVLVGEFKNDLLVKGSETFLDGSVWEGEFENRDLIKGKKTEYGYVAEGEFKPGGGMGIYNGTIIYAIGGKEIYKDGVLQVEPAAVVPVAPVVTPVVTPVVASAPIPSPAAVVVNPAPVVLRPPVQVAKPSVVGQAGKAVVLAGAIGAGALAGVAGVGGLAYGVAKIAEGVQSGEKHEDVTVDTIKDARRNLSDALHKPAPSVDEIRTLVVEANYQILHAEGPEEVKWAKPLNLIVTGKQVESILAEEAVVLPAEGTNAPATRTDKISE